MYSMPYYTYGSTANLLVLDPTALIIISKERCSDKDLHGVGGWEFFILNGGSTTVRGWLQANCGGWEHVCQGVAAG